MAAPLRLTFNGIRICKKINFPLKLVKPTLAGCRYSTITEESGEADIDIEEEINKLRDVSNLSAVNKRKMRGRTFNMVERRIMKPHSRTFLRRMYAQYGKSSGIDPSIIWPSEGELDRLIDIEKNWTTSFKDLQMQLQEKRAAETSAIQERERMVEKAMERMPKLIAEFKEQEKKSGTIKTQSRVQQDDIFDDFIEYFGYEPTLSSKYADFLTYKNMELSLEKKKQKKEKKSAKKSKKADPTDEEQSESSAVETLTDGVTNE